jgi:hypothetical protein
MTAAKYWDPVAGTWKTAGSVQGPPGPGGILSTQRIWGTANVYYGIANGQEFSVVSGTALRLQLTPAINVWWETTFHIGNIQKMDGAYHYVQPSIILTPVDADGLNNVGWTKTQHSGVQQFEPYDISWIWKLNAGVAYELRTNFSSSGGSWQYFSSSNMLLMSGKAWAR